MTGQRVLSFAAGSYKFAYVFLVDGQLIDWRMSRQASLSPENARHFAAQRISERQPNVVATEDVSAARHKGENTKAVIAAIAEVATAGDILAVAIPRPRRYANKYLEAAALAERFPELKPWVPKPRRLWDNEPPAVALFEALALALTLLDSDEA